MKIKHALIVGILGRYADRFHIYQPDRTIKENLLTAAKIPNIQGIEIVYPQDFIMKDTTINLIRKIGLPVSAVNLNVKSEAIWRMGSFTNPDPAIREKAVNSMKNAMDLAADLGSQMITCCPLIDGWDYNFEVDYLDKWRWFIEGIRQAALHRSDIKISLEYKPYEAKNTIILPNVATTLHACSQIGLDHVGVTLDIGHALAAGETPAASVCMAYDAGRMFYVHFNDNNRRWDWDMIPGSVNLWDMLETLYYLERFNWEGWMTYDVYTRNGSPAEAFATTFKVMDQYLSIVNKVGLKQIKEIIDQGVPAQAYDFLISQILVK